MSGGDITQAPSRARAALGDHEVPAGSPAEGMLRWLEPLATVEPPPRRTPAEQARTILASSSSGTLATLTSDGGPWASVVIFALLDDATPVLCLSRLALHGRNLQSDPRASLAVAEPVPDGQDPTDSGRVTLAGTVHEPEGEVFERARAAYRAVVPSAAIFDEFGDFTLWLLRIDRVRWVGGFGRMSSVTPEQLALAAPDPVAAEADYAVRHLNRDHADTLLLFAKQLAGHTDAIEARCVRADRYGLDLEVDTARGRTSARVGFTEPVDERDGLRAATVQLARRARGERA